MRYMSIFRSIDTYCGDNVGKKEGTLQGQVQNKSQKEGYAVITSEDELQRKMYGNGKGTVMLCIHKQSAITHLSFMTTTYAIHQCKQFNLHNPVQIPLFFLTISLRKICDTVSLTSLAHGQRADTSFQEYLIQSLSYSRQILYHSSGRYSPTPNLFKL